MACRAYVKFDRLLNQVNGISEPDMLSSLGLMTSSKVQRNVWLVKMTKPIFCEKPHLVTASKPQRSTSFDLKSYYLSPRLKQLP
ncbi:hypothetical protein R6Q59_016559 [Mikania micrantha]